MIRAAALLASLTLVGAAPPAHPVAVELFTSQGCASCPPADAIMGKLAADPRIVAITRPVTYWDRLGWTDTLARPENTALQQRYARTVAVRPGTYTPQAVVQGRAGVIGGREGDIRAQIARAATLPEPQVVIQPARGGGRAITLSGSGPGEVVVVAMRRSVDVAIRGGENGGRRVRYCNVVRTERVLGQWSGGTARFTAQPFGLGADRYALLVRRPGGGPILAARYL